MTAGIPAVWLARTQQAWHELSQQLNDAFWENAMAHPQDFVECLTFWSAQHDVCSDSSSEIDLVELPLIDTFNESYCCGSISKRGTDNKRDSARACPTRRNHWGREFSWHNNNSNQSSDHGRAEWRSRSHHHKTTE